MHAYVHRPRESAVIWEVFQTRCKERVSDLDAHPDQAEVETLLSMLWKGVRCGLYHAGKLHGNILITGDIKEPIRIDPQARVMFVNPHVFVIALMDHLDNFRDRLIAEGPAGELSKRFERL